MSKTYCTFCGESSNIQSEGNLCHICQRGYMTAQEPPERDYVEAIEPDKWDDRFHFDELQADDERGIKN